MSCYVPVVAILAREAARCRHDADSDGDIYTCRYLHSTCYITGITCSKTRPLTHEAVSSSSCVLFCLSHGMLSLALRKSCAGLSGRELLA